MKIKECMFTRFDVDICNNNNNNDNTHKRSDKKCSWLTRSSSNTSDIRTSTSHSGDSGFAVVALVFAVVD